MSGYHNGLATRHQVKQKDIYGTFSQQKRFRMSFELLGLVLGSFAMSNISSQEYNYIKYYVSSKLKSIIHVVDSARYALVDTFVNADQL